MKTDAFLSALAADTLPRATVQTRMTRALPIGLAVSVVALTFIWGIRPDLMTAFMSIATMKTIGPVVLAALAVPLALSLSRPDPSSPRSMGNALLVFGASALAVFGAALVVGGGSALLEALMVPSLLVCFLSIPILAMPILGAVLWALSAGAALNAGRAGMVSGLVAGGLSTGVYSLYCDQDALLFFLPAYGAAMGFVAMLGKFAGQRVLRW
jgi:hypothetical protein